MGTGRKPGDAIATGVWSKRMADALRKCEATGVGTYPAKVLLKGRPLDGYYALHVYGKGGPFDPIRSRAKYFKKTLLSTEGLHMDESKWDGSDVFTIPGFGINMFVVERVCKVLREIDFKNMSFVLSSEAQ